MKLVTHNILHSAHKRGVQVGYPLIIQPTECAVIKSDFNAAFVKRMMHKLDYECLRGAVGTLRRFDEGLEISELPEQFDVESLEDENWLQELHRILLEVKIMEGNLICPESGRKFPISSGVPNMLLNEDEV